MIRMILKEKGIRPTTKELLTIFTNESVDPKNTTSLLTEGLKIDDAREAVNLLVEMRWTKKKMEKS